MHRLLRLSLLTVLAALLVAAPAQARSFVAKLDAPGHHPKAGKNWTIKVSAHTRSGKPVRASAYYQFLFNGQVVSTQYPSPGLPDRHKPWRFRGSYRDPIVWPARSVGIDLTFRVVVKSKGRGTKKLDYRVRVRR